MAIKDKLATLELNYDSLSLSLSISILYLQL